MSTRKEVFDDSVTTLATGHAFVDGFFLSNLWDVVILLFSSRRISSCRQVARHGGVGGMWRWKATKERTGLTKCDVLRTPMADSRRFFGEVFPFGLS